MIDFNVFIFVVIAFSMMQSVFGMGLLVFGTPTLLLLGYNFFYAAIYLLPCSVGISALQVIDGRNQNVNVSKNLYFVCLPAIACGLLTNVLSGIAFPIETIVGVFLIVSALLQFHKKEDDWVSVFIIKHMPLYHFIMGYVHGMANMGGAFLTLLANKLHSDKAQIRYTIAFYYLIFGIIQLSVLYLLSGDAFSYEMLYAVPISIAVYFFAGRSIFMKAGNVVYHNMLLLFTILYGVVLLAKPMVF